jgi:hypothetical protein
MSNGKTSKILIFENEGHWTAVIGLGRAVDGNLLVVGRLVRHPVRAECRALKASWVSGAFDMYVESKFVYGVRIVKFSTQEY